jgi:succinate-acetate transporter protein
MGSVTAPENIRWFLPVWGWFALAVWVELRKSSPEVLFITFFFVFLASAVPFVCRRVGMLRLGLFGWLLPAICATVVTQLFRTLFHLS